MNERDSLQGRLADLETRHATLLKLAQDQSDLQAKMLSMIDDLRAKQPDPAYLEETVEMLQGAAARLGERWHDANQKRHTDAVVLARQARQLRADGMTEEDIAEAIGRSVRTVSTYLNDPKYEA